MSQYVQYIAPIWPYLCLLVILNLSGLIIPLPVILQLLLNASLSIHASVLLACGMTKVSYQQVKQCEQDLMSTQQQRLGCGYVWQIVKYPLFGCLVLMVLYYLTKNADKSVTQTILDWLFVIWTVYDGGARLHLLIYQLIDRTELKERSSDKLWDLMSKLSKYLFCPLMALLLCLIYTTDKHWLLNNLFALYLTITAIKYSVIHSFKLMVPILWTLFLYDLYWVYQTDVMVTVAKSINLPLKLQFPYVNMVGEYEFSILGLGDIIIPGLFLVLCFKYGIDNNILMRCRHKLYQFRMKLYNAAFGMYFLGLVFTYTALYIFQSAQPALVFIVPCLTLSLTINNYLPHKIPLLTYNSSTMAKSQDLI